MKNLKFETANDEAVEYIQQKTIVAQVMDKLRDLIASGIYKPGDKIPTEQELAQRFGIGRSSIREAIKTFQYLGILESRVAKGTFLCTRSHISTEAILWSLLLGDDDMWEILALRQSVEETAFRTVMQKYIENKKTMEPLIQSLKAEVKNMKAAARENSNEKMIQADFNFHAILIREGGIKLFLALYNTLQAFLHEEIKKTNEARGSLSALPQDHAEIIEAMESGNLEKAVKRHGAHFDNIRKLLSIEGLRQQ